MLSRRRKQKMLVDWWDRESHRHRERYRDVETRLYYLSTSKTWGILLKLQRRRFHSKILKIWDFFDLFDFLTGLVRIKPRINVSTVNTKKSNKEQNFMKNRFSWRFLIAYDIVKCNHSRAKSKTQWCFFVAIILSCVCWYGDAKRNVIENFDFTPIWIVQRWTSQELKASLIKNKK